MRRLRDRRRGAHAAGLCALAVGVGLTTAAPALPEEAVDRDVVLQTEGTTGAVACTWTTPARGSGWPAAALLSVAGPDDRDQTVGPHRLFATLAHGLARAGVASLRCDDPGVGESTGSWLEQGYDERASDALRRLAWIREQPGIDPERVGLIGNSEGAAAAPIAAVRSPEAVDFVVALAGPGVPARDAFARTLDAAMERLGLQEAARETMRGKLGELVQLMSLPPDDPATRDGVRAFLQSGGGQLLPPYRFVPRDLEGLTDFLLSPWYRSQFAYEPASVWPRVTAPTLALAGSKDTVLPPSQHLSALRSSLGDDATARQLEGLNHVFQEAETGAPGEYATLPGSFSPRALRLVAQFVLHGALPEASPPEACRLDWSDDRAVAVLETLRSATSKVGGNWLGHGPGDSYLVLEAGSAEDEEACLGLFLGGVALDYRVFPKPPRYYARLYGYYFADTSTTERGRELDRLGQQPDATANWLREWGVDAAVLLPVNPEGLPFELPPLLLTQLAVHEAFHVDVQMPRWRHDRAGLWPTGDEQPDRAAVKECYAAQGAAEIFQEERDALVLAVQEGLGGRIDATCAAIDDFHSARERRYEALGDRVIRRHDGSDGSCVEAEATMELIEGVADWASWAYLHSKGLASTEQLLRRYRAIQAEAFYLTGAMQPQLAAILDGDGGLRATSTLARAEDGSLRTPGAQLRRAVASACTPSSD
ncbi:MAG: CocE/NonD family hydrolase [Acidobacteriota bacterium]